MGSGAEGSVWLRSGRRSLRLLLKTLVGRLTAAAPGNLDTTAGARDVRPRRGAGARRQPPRRMRTRPGSMTTIVLARSSLATMTIGVTVICTMVGPGSVSGSRTRRTPWWECGG